MLTLVAATGEEEEMNDVFPLSVFRMHRELLLPGVKCILWLSPLQWKLAGAQMDAPQPTEAVFGGCADSPVSWFVAASLLFVTARQLFLSISAHAWSPLSPRNPGCLSGDGDGPHGLQPGHSLPVGWFSCNQLRKPLLFF